MEKRIKAFAQLGNEMREIVKNNDWQSNDLGKKLDPIILRAFHENGWFTEENIKLSLEGISTWLSEEELVKWLKRYKISEKNKNVGLILAGNIPLVGFHDFMSAILSGNRVRMKMSSTDKALMPLIIERLIELEPILSSCIDYVERLTDYDAVIATGSNNSARYFEYYFREKPHIIRKNRNSIAVISGNETDEELKELGKDIFGFYGLGCRNVSKMLIPEDFDLNRFFSAIVDYHEVANHKKYANNYDYYKAFYLLNRADLLDNGFFLLKEDTSLHSPVAMLFYQRYQNEKEVLDFLKIEEENIQCVVSNHTSIPNAVPLGKSQYPAVNDYADGVDTMEFLVSL